MEFNKIIHNCLKDIELSNKKERVYYYKSKKEYIDTIKDQIGDYKLTTKEKEEIDVIIYNTKQSDGMIAATIVINYIINDSKNKRSLEEIDVIRTGEGKGEMIRKNLETISKNRNKEKLNIIMLDLEPKEEIYNMISQYGKNIIIIDEHGKKNINNKLALTTDGPHSSCALTWYVFYPKEEIPTIVASVDVSDTKKYVDYLPYTNFLSTVLTFRYTSNPYKESSFQNKSVYKELWEMIEDNTYLSTLTIIGKYMDETQENIKEQIARNAVIRNFQGFKVTVLNYSDPVLTKRIGRQMIDNAKKMGQNIDMAVLWAFEYNKNSYRVQLIDDHQQTRINLPNLARYLGKIGGSPQGGGGHGHVGNFYWMKTKEQDIWSLFENNYLEDKDLRKMGIINN